MDEIVDREVVCPLEALRDRKSRNSNVQKTARQQKLTLEGEQSPLE